MPSRRYLSIAEKDFIKYKHSCGSTMTRLAQEFKVSRRTIYNVVHNIYGERKENGGRKSRFTKQDLTRLCIVTKKYHFLPIRRIVRENIPDVPLSTYRNFLNSQGFRLRSSIKQPKLTTLQRKRRLDFAKNYQHKTLSFWQSIYYTDEVIVRDVPTKTSMKVLCSDRFPKSHCKVNYSYKNASQKMFWVAIKYDGNIIIRSCPQRMNSETFSQLICETFCNRANRTKNCLLLQDNAPCHVSKKVCSLFIMLSTIRQIHFYVDPEYTFSTYRRILRI